MTLLRQALPRRSLLRWAALPVLGVAVDAWADAGRPLRADRIVLPPDRREFSSPSGSHVLTLSSADHWQTRLALAQLQQRSGSALTPLWQKTLPQERGPRHVLVTDSGAVLLIDEWINVPSRHALMLLAPDGKELAHHGIDALVRLLGVSRRTVAEHGNLGIWLSAAPVLSDDGNAVFLASAGRKLILRLADGQLSVAD